MGDRMMDSPLQRRNTHISALFPEILTIIFNYLEVEDKGRAAQVCVRWRDSAYHRVVWKGVEAKLHVQRGYQSLFVSLVKRGITKIQVLSTKHNLNDVITGVTVKGVTYLEHLNLSGCTGLMDNSLKHSFYDQVDRLTHLNLSLCKNITDRSMDRISRLFPNLEVLDLSGCCEVTSAGLSHFAKCLHNLRYLNLRSCRRIDDGGIKDIACQGQLDVNSPREAQLGCPRLETLILQDCQKLTDQALYNISLGLFKLQELNLSFCITISDAGLRYISKMPCLRKLNLRSCDNISDTGIGYLAEAGSPLRSLNVSFCERIGDATLSHISQGLFQLSALNLSASNITDEGVKRLCRTAVDITTLNIGQCSRITDASLKVIAQNLKNLERIDLYGCTEVTQQGIEHLTKLPKLKVINLCLCR